MRGSRRAAPSTGGTIVSVGTVLEEVHAVVLSLAKRRDIVFDTSAADDRLAIIGDHDRLRQILVNLVGNAIKFTPPGGRVAVATEPSAEHVTISVSDTGPGIPSADAERIFHPFVQLDRALNQPVKGTGLGLAISREFARGMGAT